jgi:hypothetical protein
MTTPAAETKSHGLLANAPLSWFLHRHLDSFIVTGNSSPLTGTQSSGLFYFDMTTPAHLPFTIQLQLDKLTRDSSYFITTLFQDEHIKKPKWFFIIPLLSFSSLMSILLIPFTPQFFFVLLGVMIINLGIQYWNKQNLHEYLGTIPYLLILMQVTNSTLTDMKNRPVFTFYPQGEQAGFSAFTPWGRGKKAEKPDWILICQSRTKKLLKFKLLKEINEDVPESIRSIEKIRSHISFFKLEVKFKLI